MSYFERTQVQASDSPSIDAFGRWRVSNPATLFDGRWGYTETVVWSDLLISGTLSSTEFSPQASVTFTSTANTAGDRIRQSYKRFPYTAGKSQLVLCTFVLGSPVGGNKKRVGYFDDRNGLFLQQDGSEISFNRRTYVTGSAVDNKVVQADWNLDKLDGTGASGITIDFTKTQILVIDFEWLGVGRVRMGFNIDGITYYCHEFLNANNLDKVYMSTGSLPIRYQMTHNGTGEASTLTCICAAVISEGGQDPIGQPCARTTNGEIGSLSAGTAYVIKGLRLKAANVYGPVVKFTGADIIGTTQNDYFDWLLVKDETVTGTLTWTSVPYSSVEHTTGNGTQTVNVTHNSVKILNAGVGFSRSLLTIDPKDDIALEVTANNTPVPLYLVIVPRATMKCIGVVRWREFA